MLQFSIKYLLLFANIFVYSESAKILGVFAIPGKSHYMAGKTLMKILAEAGHEVTVVSPFEEKNPPKNYKSIALPGVLEQAEKDREKFFHFGDRFNPFAFKILSSIFSSELLENTVSNPEFIRLLKSNEKFDLILLEPFLNDGLIFLNWYYKIPIILFSALDASFIVNYNVGNPSPPSYIPCFVFSYPPDMSFLERTTNFLYELLNYVTQYWVVLPMQTKIIQKYFPEVPHLQEISNNVSLVFLNSNPSISNPVPKVPNMIDIGGFHLNDPSPLPSDLQKTLDNAKEGVILFSMGSNLKSVDMPKELRQVLVNTFGKLKETVLWKWELDELPEKPKNVKIMKWIPQQDILNHKNVKLFITHGGIFSTMEAIHSGVPILTIPVFGDQEMNARKVEQGGYGKMVLLKDLKEKFSSTLNEVLLNKKYKENMLVRSSLLKDSLVKPRDKIKYYVDYVLRHKGAPHLQVAGVKLPWYQYYCLDIITVLIVCVYLMLYVLKKTIGFLINVFKKNKNVNKVKKN